MFKTGISRLLKNNHLRSCNATGEGSRTEGDRGDELVSLLITEGFILLRKPANVRLTLHF